MIGNRNYEHSDVPAVEYALRDAEVMRRYLVEAFGYREGNIIFVPDASAARLQEIFGTASDPKGQLYNYVKPGESDVFIYYSGHGVPDLETGKTVGLF